MKTVILDGTVQHDPRHAQVRRLLVEEVHSFGGPALVHALDRIPIAPCMGCFGCWVKTPGLCVVEDAGRGVARSALLCDLLVFLTPVTFGGYSSALKNAVDRMIPLLSPFVMRIEGGIHHRPRYPRYPPIFGLGLLAEPDPEKERIFRTLVGRNAVNYHSPFHAAEVASPGREESVRTALRAVLARCGRG